MDHNTALLHWIATLLAAQPAAPSGPPIIIVPSVQTAILTLSNAKLFLEQGKFVSSAEALKAAGAVSTLAFTSYFSCNCVHKHLYGY
jgi:hypothetical protein